MTRLLCVATLAALACLSIPARAQIPAFPGADGAGRDVSGGRGGIVYHVTTLDRGFGYTGFANAGTLRYGLNDANFAPGTKRTIVFDVAGTFWIGRYGEERGHYDGWDSGGNMSIGSNVTLAGQTAPGPVIIAGSTVKLSNGSGGVSNSIVRNITISPGYGQRSFEKPDETPPVLPTPGDFPDSYVFDALDISANQAIVDHVSTFYATDETISANEIANNLTIQYSNISQGQNYPQADAENPGVYTGHALGSLLQAGSNAKISVLNNLYAHQKGRLPRVGSEVGTGAFNDFRNNVFYNWLGTGGSGASGQPSFNNFISNFWLAGPGGDDASGTNIVNAVGGTQLFNGASSTVTRVFQTGNLKDINKDGDPNDGVITTASSSSSSSFDFRSVNVQTTAYNVNIGVTLGAKDAFENVLKYMGANWWERDYDITNGDPNAIDTVDERIIHETFTGTGKIKAWADNPFNDLNPPPAGWQPYDPNEGSEWRALLDLRVDPVTLQAPFNRSAGWDTDGDGMPGYWEAAHGFSDLVANNNGDADADGYTDLEEYLNDVAAWPAPGEIVFNGGTSQYAKIQNWDVFGQTLSISNVNVTTSSKWQPSRYDIAVVRSGSVLVDKVGQHAGTLKVAPTDGDSATLTISAGWLRVQDTLEIGAAGTSGVVQLQGTGQLHVHRLTSGPNGDFQFTGGLLNADIVEFDLENNGGTIAPGQNTFNLPGAAINFGGIDTMQVLGDLTITSGLMQLEIGGNLLPEYDRILVDGKLDAGGTLEVLLAGYNPVDGDVFDLFNFGTVDGSFNLMLPNIGESLAWDTSQLLVSGELSVMSAVTFDPDFNGDDSVDGQDFLIWQTGFGLDDQPDNSTGDADGDGDVDGDDLMSWESAYGLPVLFSAVSAATTNVPEPASVLLAVGCITGFALRRQRVL